ncbi:MAG TPA: hypothetical protein VG840_10150 [Casimicrobiaceae bacterium]|nr:hypothetical protein [Casimicrobiaceae bacterium]
MGELAVERICALLQFADIRETGVVVAQPGVALAGNRQRVLGANAAKRRARIVDCAGRISAAQGEWMGARKLVPERLDSQRRFVGPVAPQHADELTEDDEAGALPARVGDEGLAYREEALAIRPAIDENPREHFVRVERAVTSAGADDVEIEASGAPARFECGAMTGSREYDSRRAARQRATDVFRHGVDERIIALVQVREVHAMVDVARRGRRRVNERRSHAGSGTLRIFADSVHGDNGST